MSADHHRDGFTISTDPARLEIGAIGDFLLGTYWGRQRGRETIEKSLRHSLCFGLYEGDKQIGFARAVTDYATFAYVADVFVLDPWRRRGLGRWLVQTMTEHSELRNIRRWCLITQDAQEFYRQCGFTGVDCPEHYMERLHSIVSPGRIEGTSEISLGDLSIT
jgi:N-acetylglutamate synthase-like GNAT family acetyltransferase